MKNNTKIVNRKCLAVLFFSSTLIISCVDDETEEIITRKTLEIANTEINENPTLEALKIPPSRSENNIPSEIEKEIPVEETPKEIIEDSNETENEPANSNNEREIDEREIIILASAERNTTRNIPNTNAPSRFGIIYAAYAPLLHKYLIEFRLAADPNNETVNYTVNINGVTIVENVVFPVFPKLVRNETPPKELLIDVGNGEAIGQGNYFIISRNSRNNNAFISIDTATSPFKLNPERNNLIELVAHNTSGIRRPSENIFRF